MCRHCSADPSFRGFDLRLSPLGAPVVFAARRCLPFRRLPLGGLAFGLTASAFRHAPLRGCPRRVDLRAHGFRFSARTASGLPLGELALPSSASELPFGGLAFGFTTSAFRHAPIRGCPRRVGLRAHCFRFSACTDSEIAARRIGSSAFRFGVALGGLAFGLTASAFRPAPLRSGCWASSFFRLPLRRFPSAGWPSDSRLPLFGTHRFGVAAGRIGLRASASEWPRRAGSSAGRVGLRAHCFRFSACTASEMAARWLVFGLTASAFRHAPLRSGRWASWFFRWAGWPSGSLLPLFGTRRSAPLHRRSEDRRSTTTRQLFHFKTLIPTC